MDLDLVTLHDKALSACGKTFRNIGKSQWHAPTPDTEWDVRALANHITSENFWVAPLMAGRTIDEIGSQFEGDVLGQHPTTSYDLSAKQASEALHEDNALDVKVQLSVGAVPAETYIEQRLIDLVIHNWDLATAVKSNNVLDGELVSAVLQIVVKQQEDLTSSGMFADPVEIPDDANDQTRLLALLGRKG